MIGIVGQGFVGNAVYQKFKKYYDVLTHDKDDTKSTSTLTNLVVMCDTIFLCLPVFSLAVDQYNLDVTFKSLLTPLYEIIVSKMCYVCKPKWIQS